MPAINSKKRCLRFAFSGASSNVTPGHTAALKIGSGFSRRDTSLEEVLLTPRQEREFERRYLDIKGDTPRTVKVPCVDAFPDL